MFDTFLQKFNQEANSTALNPGAPDPKKAASFLMSVGELYGKLHHIAQGHEKSSVRMSTQLMQARVGHLSSELEHELNEMNFFQHHLNKHHERMVDKQHSGISAEIIAVNNIWWEMREKVSHYLSALNKQFASYDHALTLLQNYGSCSAGLSEVTQAYQRAHVLREGALDLLENTFRDLAYSTGQLQSMLVDGNLLADCTSLEDRVYQYAGTMMSSEYLLETIRDRHFQGKGSSARKNCKNKNGSRKSCHRQK